MSDKATRKSVHARREKTGEKKQEPCFLISEKRDARPGLSIEIVCPLIETQKNVHVNACTLWGMSSLQYVRTYVQACGRVRATHIPPAIAQRRGLPVTHVDDVTAHPHGFRHGAHDARARFHGAQARVPDLGSHKKTKIR